MGIEEWNATHEYIHYHRSILPDECVPYDCFYVVLEKPPMGIGITRIQITHKEQCPRYVYALNKEATQLRERLGLPPHE